MKPLGWFTIESAWCLYKKRKFGLAKGHQGHVNMKERPCEDTGRRQSYAGQRERSQGKPHIPTL